MRAYFNPKNDEINQWLDKYAPSKTSYQTAPWIQIKNPKFGILDTGNEQSAIEEFRYYVSEKPKNEINKELILKIAKKHKCVTGKWIIWLEKKEVDEKWGSIAKSILDGKLSSFSAKISTNGHPSTSSGEYLVCVYTLDYSEMQEVMKVREELKNLGFTSALCYKADIYTYLKIYGKNEYGLSEVLYSK